MERRARRQQSEEQVLTRLAAMCATAEHCESEIREKCRNYGLEEAAAERIVAALKRDKFIDEGRFAVAYVRDKARFNGWGPIKISMAMREKGIESTWIEDSMEEIGEEEWKEILKKAMKGKVKRGRNEDPRKAFASAVRFGMQRGFEYEIVKRVYQELTDGDDINIEEI